ncbi:VWA domain-containing protein [Ornithinibacillus sp. FSL M8-0202]|uniref:VWA domain-containing protein n=1 Tax=unclassified Ornithinibacillus TaxID=2620869 RepID=UPI0030CE2FDF
MKRNSLVILTLLVTLIMATGCNKDNKDEQEDVKPIEPPETDNQETTVVEEEDSDQENETDSQELLSNLDEVPRTVSDIIHQKAGKYAGMDVRDESVVDQVLEDLNILDPLPEDASEDQLNDYFKYIYALVAEDFPDPKDTIKKWEFGSFGDPDLPDSRFHFKENYNVEVLLDGSGSMGAYIGNKTMMQIAKETINEFMKQVPGEANVSLRVYGHKGTGSNSDKELSCSTIEQVYGYAPYEETAFQKELDEIEPAGWTPLADALKQAEESLSQFDTENNTNLIYVVSDGVETCDGDPVAVAKSLSDSNAKPIINIIGFNVDNQAQAQLKAMADISGGIFSTANDQSELEEEFKRAEEVLKAWERWKKEALRDVNAIRVENNFDILKIGNEWGHKETRQSNNIARAARLLKNEEIITLDQMNYLRSIRDDVRKIIREGQDEVKNELKDISTERIEELKKSIDEKYNEGTED